MKNRKGCDVLRFFMIKTATHPSGLSVLFDEEKHIYTVKETGRVLISSTTFIDEFFPHFDADKIAPLCVGKAKYQGMTAEQIKVSWEANAKRARDEGTNVHEYAQCLWAGLSRPKPISERSRFLFDQVDKAGKKLMDRGFEFVDAEKIIFSPELEIAGMIDLLLYDPRTRDYVIIDWKQNETISVENKWDNAKPPISHLEASDYVKYSLQLNLYRFILRYEGYYPHAPHIRMALIHLTENGNRPIRIHFMPEIFHLLAAKKIRDQKP